MGIIVPYTISDYLITRLIQNGVDTLFGVPAVYCAPVFEAARRAAAGPGTFRTIVTASDLEAGYAADGYARIKGLSVVSVAYGVGTLSLLNAIAGAYVERSPVVVINGGPSQASIDQQTRTGVLFSHSMGQPHSDLVAFGPFTAFSERATMSSTLPGLVDKALVAALTQKRPVYLEVPQGWLDTSVTPPTRPLDLTIAPGPAAAAANAILTRLRAARKPMLIVGIEVQRYGLAGDVLALIDALGIPWTTTLLAKSTLPEGHRGFLGVFNGEKAPQTLRDAIAAADAILSLGAVFGSGHARIILPRLDRTMRAWNGTVTIPRAAPSSVSIEALIAELRRLATAPAMVGPESTLLSTDNRPSVPMPTNDAEWAWDGDREGVPAIEATSRSTAPPSPTPVPAGLDYDDVVAAVQDPAFLDQSMVIVPDTCLGIYPSAQMRVPATSTFVAGAIWASIGHSVGAAVGIGAAGRRAVVLCGDGGFQMVPQALSTMAAAGQNAIVVVIDNGLYGYEQYLLGPGYFRSGTPQPLPYAVLPRWDYEALARALGVSFTARVDDTAELRRALSWAKGQTGSPTLIHALVRSRSLPTRL